MRNKLIFFSTTANCPNCVRACVCVRVCACVHTPDAYLIKEGSTVSREVVWIGNGQLPQNKSVITTWRLTGTFRHQCRVCPSVTGVLCRHRLCIRAARRYPGNQTTMLTVRGSFHGSASGRRKAVGTNVLSSWAHKRKGRCSRETHLVGC